MKLAHLLSILGLLAFGAAFGANVAAADPPGNHDDFTGSAARKEV